MTNLADQIDETLAEILRLGERMRELNLVRIRKVGARGIHRGCGGPVWLRELLDGQVYTCSRCGKEPSSDEVEWLPEFAPGGARREPLMIEQYKRDGVDVKVLSGLRGKDHEYSLCHRCERFKPNAPAEHCHIANELLMDCLAFKITTVVWECPMFKQKVELEPVGLGAAKDAELEARGA